jgi:hypothetical protein
VAAPDVTSSQVVENQMFFQIEEALFEHQGSWNVFSMSVGSADVGIPQVLTNWYKTQCTPTACTPWQPSASQSCPNWAAVAHQATSPTVSTTLRQNLDEVFEIVSEIQPSIRRIQVLSPYLVDRNRTGGARATANPCAAAATTAINDLDAIRPNALLGPGSPVRTADLRSLFGVNPVPAGVGTDAGLIQTTAPFGYPNPGRAGQAVIASDVAALVG